MHSGLMYRVYQNQGQEPITLGVTSLDRFYILPLMKSFRHTFFKNCKGLPVTKLKPGTLMDSGFYCIYQNQGQGSITFGIIAWFYNLP